MRSLLFVPGDSERKLEKGFQSGADLVIIDLEDSVAPANKPLDGFGVHPGFAAYSGAKDLRSRQRPVDRPH